MQLIRLAILFLSTLVASTIAILYTNGDTKISARWSDYKQTSDLDVNLFSGSECTIQTQNMTIGPLKYNQNNTGIASAYMKLSR